MIKLQQKKQFIAPQELDRGKLFQRYVFFTQFSQRIFIKLVQMVTTHILMFSFKLLC